MNAYELSMQVRRLMKDHDYAGALACFKAHRSAMPMQEIAANPWLISSVVMCLRKTGQGSFVEVLFEQFSIGIHADCHAQVMGAYGWVLYDRLKAMAKGEGMDGEEEDMSEAVPFGEGESVDVGVEPPTVSMVFTQADEWLGFMCDRMDGFEYMVVTKVLMYRVKAERSRQRPDWGVLHALLERFRPEQFSETCEKGRLEVKGKEREVEYASDRESWYAAMILVRSKLGMHMECKALAEEALDRFSTLHYGNEVWFARRLAMAERRLGDRESAIRGVEALLRKKDTWFLRKELAELLWEAGRRDESLVHCRVGMAGHGELRYKVGLLWLMARILRVAAESELSARHFRLCMLLRQGEGWAVSPSMQAEMAELPEEVMSIQSVGHLIHDLAPYWKSAVEAKRPKGARVEPTLFGTIQRIQNDNERGIDGFIQPERGPKIYFTARPDASQRKGWKAGVRVRFGEIVQPDGRKKAVSVELC